MDKSHKCTICLMEVMGEEYFANVFAHAACVEHERTFPLRTTGTPCDILNQHEEEAESVEL